MDACLKLLFAISLFNLFGFSHGYFQWSVQHEATMCLGGNVNLIWDYTTNETTSIVLWEKLGSPNILVARIFGGKFNAIAPYNGRVTQTNLGNAAILISSVTTNDSGTYGCTIQSAHSENITLVVAETPSGLPYFNKTEKSLTCNPPQNLGSPNVETKLKFQNGTAKSALTATESGTYQCCIIGDAVKCLSSASNAATEACVNETLVKPSEGKLTPGAIAAIAIGVVAGLIIIFVFVYFCIIKKKTRTQQLKDKESQGTLTQNDDESNNLENKPT